MDSLSKKKREKGKVGLSVHWKYITMAYGGALVPFILLAQVLFQVLQIGSNYWMAWATPVITCSWWLYPNDCLCFIGHWKFFLHPCEIHASWNSWGTRLPVNSSVRCTTAFSVHPCHFLMPLQVDES